MKNQRTINQLKEPGHNQPRPEVNQNTLLFTVFRSSLQIEKRGGGSRCSTARWIISDKNSTKNRLKFIQKSSQKTKQKSIKNPPTIDQTSIKNRSWRRLGASWGVLAAPWDVLGRLGGVLAASLEPLGGVLVANMVPTWLPKRSQNQ